MTEIIAVENLVKSYGSVEAVKNISFKVEQGKLFAFLGPNGAGKSTTIDIISFYIR
ncbi:MAG: antibiotic transport system ATP-binding protein [Fusobacteria bacterium]|nr:MAG: antibiotic transport system ATP-binding protein [Fusobacteriota bacterium]KAF0230233.1 MAG: antibiotic transport system ATP-binding [Fusobacteriota bacterium]